MKKTMKKMSTFHVVSNEVIARKVNSNLSYLDEDALELPRPKCLFECRQLHVLVVECSPIQELHVGVLSDHVTALSTHSPIDFTVI